MDHANLDGFLPGGDPEEEIVVGTWLDDGSYNDWLAGDDTKNRGHLIILDPSKTGAWPRSLDAEVLGATGPFHTIGAGVYGVKVDDVNGDGWPEIWCGDEMGHVWLFYVDDNDQWTAFARSADVGMWVGYFNNIFPIKAVGGLTTRLVVVSAGYVMEFGVDYTLLPIRGS